MSTMRQILFSVLICAMLSRFSCVQLFVTQLFATLWTVAHQALLSMGFSRQESWNGSPFPSPRAFPNTGIKPTSLKSPVLAGGKQSAYMNYFI